MKLEKKKLANGRYFIYYNDRALRSSLTSEEADLIIEWLQSNLLHIAFNIGLMAVDHRQESEKLQQENEDLKKRLLDINQGLAKLQKDMLYITSGHIPGCQWKTEKACECGFVQRSVNGY